MVQTTTGPIAPEALGRVMMHEHLAPTATADPELLDPRRWPSDPFIAPPGPDAVIENLKRLKAAGIDTVVDVTPTKTGRDPEYLRRVSEVTGLNIVAATGFYKESAMPDWAFRASMTQLTEHILRELTEGIEGTGIRAGIIKVGSSLGRVTAAEARVLRAAAEAHRETGAPITTHATLGTAGRQQAELLASEGVDLSRVVIGHSDLNAATEYHRQILQFGASLGFDTWGKEWFDYVRLESAGIGRFQYEKEAYHVPDRARVERLLPLMRGGYAEQVVLSMDLTHREIGLNAGTFGLWGYRYFPERVLPFLEEAGLDAGQVEAMLVTAPSRILAGQ